jgi:hypothetical protein
LAARLTHTVVVMDNRAQVREFLVSRRERISPAQAGLPAYGGGNRRVKGLRREEVALLAGVSIDYYVRFHRTGHKRLRHPVVGTLDLDFEAMEFPAHPGLTLVVYTAAAGTPAADNLKLLASWAATAEQTRDLPTYA